MKKIIILFIVLILVVSIISAANNEQKKEKGKVKKTKELINKKVSEENNTKLIDFYSSTFPEIKHMNDYKQYNNITILNVTLENDKYARLITNTNKFNNILR